MASISALQGVDSTSQIIQVNGLKQSASVGYNQIEARHRAVWTALWLIGIVFLLYKDVADVVSVREGAGEWGEGEI